MDSAKQLAACQLRMMTSTLQANPNQMAIGADDQYVRLWDRRMLSAGGRLAPQPQHFVLVKVCGTHLLHGHILACDTTACPQVLAALMARRSGLCWKWRLLTCALVRLPPIVAACLQRGPEPTPTRGG